MMRESSILADVGWPMSIVRFSLLFHPSVMEVTSDHYVIFEDQHTLAEGLESLLKEFDINEVQNIVE
jgi:hypothetical protein